MYTVGAATSLVVLSEYFLTVLVLYVTARVIVYRANRKLRTEKYLDFAEIAWATRPIVVPELVLRCHPVAIINVIRITLPLVILGGFVFIGNSVEQGFSHKNFSPQRTLVFAGDDYSDTIGRKAVYARSLIERAVDKGTWRGVPAKVGSNVLNKESLAPLTEGIPIRDDEFRRMQWEAPTMYKCKQVLYERAEYTFAERNRRIFYFPKSLVRVPQGTIVRKSVPLRQPLNSFNRKKRLVQNETNITRGWVATPFRNSSRVIEKHRFLPDQAFIKYSFGKVDPDVWRDTASGAAVKVDFSKWNVGLDEYATLLSSPNKLPKICRKVTESDIIVDYVGVPQGKHLGVSVAKDKFRLSLTRGFAHRQRFRCQKRKMSGKVCDPPAVSSLSLIAGLTALMNQPSSEGVLRQQEVSPCARGLNASIVAEALEVGLHVLRAGAAVSYREGVVLLPTPQVRISWTYYGLIVGCVILTCAILVGYEALSRSRAKLVKTNVVVPLDAFCMAQICGALMTQERSSPRGLLLPRDYLGMGIKYLKEDTGSDDHLLQVGSQESKEKREERWQ